MAQPWLDDLSEDWDAPADQQPQKKSSSPASNKSASLSDRSFHSSPGGITSRIPRPTSSTSNRKSPVTNYIRPRSAKGLARLQSQRDGAENVLSERSLNIGSLDKEDSSNGVRAKSLPRRISGSAFGDSVGSVQHHTLHKRSQGKGAIKDSDTPEWKRRLLRGEKIGEVDLFGGKMEIEGLFQQPQPKKDGAQDTFLSSSVVGGPPENPWSLPVDYNKDSNDIMNRSTSTKFTSRPRMGVLVEEDTQGEDESSLRESKLDVEINDSTPNIPNDLAEPQNYAEEDDDPRQRTVSGQEELRNENISPITISKQNTMNEKLLKNILEGDDLNSKLSEEESEIKMRRPSTLRSVSADKIIRRPGFDATGYKKSTQEIVADLEKLASQSLPDDLSMGTDDFMGRGGYINTRRGGAFSEENSSFMRRENFLSTAEQNQLQFRSSPPPYSIPQVPESLLDKEDLEVEEPTLPQTPSPKRKEKLGSPMRDEHQRSSGSPLKLFGDYDTYTKDRLSRRLSQWELGHDGTTETKPKDDLQPEKLNNDERQHPEPPVHHDNEEEEIRMSQFGQGDLNNYSFIQHSAIQEADSKSSTPSQLGTIFKQTTHYEKSTQLPKSRKGNSTKNRTIEKTTHEESITIEVTTNVAESKRGLTSPGKERTPKRRRTFFKDEFPKAQEEEELVMGYEKSKNKQHHDTHEQHPSDSMTSEQLAQNQNQIAGRKRKDARYDGQGGSADPDVLATRQMLRPRSSTGRKPSSQRDSTTTHKANGTGERLERKSSAQMAQTGAVDSLTNAVANELATFAESVREDVVPSSTTAPMTASATTEEIRKPSITTQGYFAEATKVMEMIRQKKSFRAAMSPPDKNGVSTAEKPPVQMERSEVEVDDWPESTLEPFSRPPSREYVVNKVPQPKVQRINPRVVSHLRKFEDPPSPVAKIRGENGEEGEVEKWDEDLLESDPPGLRLRGQAKTKTTSDKRGKDGSARPASQNGGEGINTSSSHGGTHSSSTTRTIPTAFSSGSAGDRGLITSDKLNLPTQVNGMIFDKATLSWVKHTSADPTSNEDDNKKGSGDDRKEASEEDPFDDIPDLSVDETEEIKRTREARLEQQERVKAMKTSPGVEVHDHEESVVEQVPLQPQASATTTTTTHSIVPRHSSITGFVGRPVSRIDEEQDDHDNQAQDMSLIHVTQVTTMTPMPISRNLPASLAAKIESSLLCLTPLSDFTFHQNDSPKNLELSYVAQRTHPTSLQQAHGQFSLAVDEMVRAITDVEPYEPYWDHLRRLDLDNKNITTLHRLSDYCPRLEQLSVADNEIGQIAGLPSSLRTLNIASNHLNEINAWGHLSNLQYLDVSENKEIDSLNGFASLKHLRELKANGCGILDLGGITREGGLDALLSLKVKENKLTGTLDFEGTEM